MNSMRDTVAGDSAAAAVSDSMVAPAGDSPAAPAPSEPTKPAAQPTAAQPKAPASDSPSQTPSGPMLISAREDGVETLTLNRPAQYNALSEELLDDLAAALDRVASDESIRVVILAAAGKAFCAGHDLKQMRANASRAYQQALFAKCSAIMTRLPALPQPVIARVQGMATAAGCQLVASCDLAVAAAGAQFAVSGVRVGLFCSTPAVALSRNVARKRALDMLLTGDFIDAATAREYGLVNRVVDAAELDAAAGELARSIAAKPPRVIQLGKRRFYEQLKLGLGDAYQLATDAMADNMLFDETREGIDAFIEKRRPNWN